jgi:aspartate aminotransferase
VRESFREANLGKSWYQSHSAFYYMVDFSQAPIIEKFRKDKDDTSDYSMEICEEMLEKEGLALVPGKAFGLANTARMSLVLPKEPFTEAVSKMVNYLSKENS